MKKWLRNILTRRFGIKIRRNYYPSSIQKEIGINLLIDVGCNRGQYAEGVLENNSCIDLVLIDAIPGCVDHCRRKFQDLPNVRVLDAVAISENEGTLEFFLSENEFSSSLAMPPPTLVQAFPGVAIKNKIIVDSKPLDNLFTYDELQGKKIMLKIDANGADLSVLRGAKKLLKIITAVQIEISLPAAGVSEMNGNSIFDILSNSGFELYRVEEGVRNRSGAQLTCDLIMVRV